MAPERATRSTLQRRLRVGHYGGGAVDGLAADERCVPRAVDRRVADADLECLLVEWDVHDAPLEAVASGVQSGVPVVVLDPEGVASRAAEATRAGAAEYVTPAALDGETVADRVVEAAVASGSGVEGGRCAATTDPGGPPDAGGSGDHRQFARLFDGLPDAVVDAEFVDGQPVVRSVNDAFEEIFGYDAADVRGESVNALLVPEEYAEEASRIDRRAATAGHSINEVERLTDRGRRTFLFRWLRYPTAGDARRGFGIYTDVTRRKRQQRRLRVLHRVLRHNLRNEITAMTGYIDLLEEVAEAPETERYVEGLRGRAESIAALGEQAQHIEEAFDEEHRVKSAVDPAAVAGTVLARYREEHPAATVEFSAPDDAPMALADRLLERAVDAVVENAFEHHDGTPAVEATVEPHGDRWVDVVVSDDGPGIPERERRILSGEREITQLDHSMGLGLWVARWVVEGVGGRLRFDDREDGTTVRLRLQRPRASG
ncbi:sensor histidine kinase [Natronomonas marina]|uniref:sensor histidine kinase n=1 Tax=Natronomonas marina TaxID=2961939 RepID=UPI0020C94D32|nr:PAS domain-containing sensor histidine kinase [Natronomonas marina]